MEFSRVTAVAIGSVLVFVIAMLAVIPYFGILLGPLFTLGGGLVGGAVAGGLVREGGQSGLAAGAIAGFIGGSGSAIIGTSLTLFLSWIGVLSEGVYGESMFIMGTFVITGIITGIVLTTVGGSIGGTISGYLVGTGEDDTR